MMELRSTLAGRIALHRHRHRDPAVPGAADRRHPRHLLQQQRLRGVPAGGLDAELVQGAVRRRQQMARRALPERPGRRPEHRVLPHHRGDRGDRPGPQRTAAALGGLRPGPRPAGHPAGRHRTRPVPALRARRDAGQPDRHRPRPHRARLTDRGAHPDRDPARHRRTPRGRRGQHGRRPADHRPADHLPPRRPRHDRRGDLLLHHQLRRVLHRPVPVLRRHRHPAGAGLQLPARSTSTPA